ncbi:MAG: histidine kinase N-terminal 7TM domain-containing protein [Christensenellales bacterium]
MISDFSLVVLIVSILAIVAFLWRTLKGGTKTMIHKLYIVFSSFVIIWMLALVVMKFVPTENITLLYVLDSLMYLGVAGGPTICLLIVLTFIKDYEKFPRYYYLLLVVPVLTNIIVWTNPLHHLFYNVFSIFIDKLEFGPYFMFSAGYNFMCFVVSTVIILNFAIKSNTKLYLRQAILFSVGSVIPVIVNTMAIFQIGGLSNTATPLSMTVTILLHGLAIYRLHFLDIKPLALQRLLDWVSDCYLVTTDAGLVVNFNKPFQDVFGYNYGITEGVFLRKCVKSEDVENKTGIYNLLTSIEACRKSGSGISYEQAVMSPDKKDGSKKSYYMVEITPLIVNKKIHGFVSIFKNVTKVKESMQKLQDNQARMMEQERLASLGQMMGGLAHNLKTPIMSISGSVSAVENLVRECVLSVGDEEVRPEDYKEIYGEIDNWLQKVRDACAYMSDIISAIKGQAATMSGSDNVEFSVDELLKRVSLLMYHELLHSNCHLVIDHRLPEEVLLHGDINTLVQVINNMVSNAIDAQQPKGGGAIVVGVDKDETMLKLFIKDTGTGVSEDIKQHLFKQMITSKGAQGSGLGIYMSNAVIRGRFGGTMWFEDNPEGGTIFGISIPLEHVNLVKRKQLRN